MSDLVEREVVREKMIYYGFHAPDMTVHEFVEDELPSVTPSRRKGHWIIDREVIDTTRKPTTYHFDTHCFECGFKYAYTTDKEDSIPTNFCPNCGAKMVEPQESEDKE